MEGTPMTLEEIKDLTAQELAAIDYCRLCLALTFVHRLAHEDRWARKTLQSPLDALALRLAKAQGRRQNERPYEWCQQGCPFRQW